MPGCCTVDTIVLVTARLNALILCDFAQIREGLLFVQSGGLTRLVASTFPAQFGCHIAALVYLPPHEAGEAHGMVIKAKAAETATLVATVKVSMHEIPPPAGLKPGEGRQIPIVVPLSAISFPSPGEYDLHVEIDEEFAGEISFRVENRPAPPAAPS